MNPRRFEVLSIVTVFFCMLCPRTSAQSQILGPKEDGTHTALTDIATRAAQDSSAFGCLRELSDHIGGRVTGSPAAQAAIDWALAKMRGVGLANVRKEDWSLWKGWQRGVASAEMISPLHRGLYVDSMGWTGSTAAGGVDADVVGVNVFQADEEVKDVSRFNGKIILMRADGTPKKSLGAVMMQYGEFLKKLQGSGVVALIGGEGGFKSPGMHLTHTGSLVVEKESPFPVLSMAAEDQGSSVYWTRANRFEYTFTCKTRSPLARSLRRTWSEKSSAKSMPNKLCCWGPTWTHGIWAKAPQTTGRTYAACFPPQKYW